MIRNFLFALQFLTIIPVKISHIEKTKLSNSLIFFPLVGLLLGLILAGVNSILPILSFGQFPINVILIILLIVLTGGIHLDGLADTVDALLSRKDKEEMLRIMRDSHIGAMGVLSLVCIIILKIALLSSVSMPLKTITLLLMCTLSRWALVLPMFLFPYARNEGKAKVFIQGINLKILFSTTIITLSIVVLVWQLKGLLIFGLTAMSSYIIGRFINNKIGGITGDALGTMNELIELIVLFSICVLGGSPLWMTW